MQQQAAEIFQQQQQAASQQAQPQWTQQLQPWHAPCDVEGAENRAGGINWARSEGSSCLLVGGCGDGFARRPPSPHTIAKWVEEALRSVESAGVPATRDKILTFIWTKYKVPMELEKRVQQSVDATLHRGMRRKELILKGGAFRVAGRRSAP